MAGLPRTAQTGHDYLARFAGSASGGWLALVSRDPAKPSNGVSRPALDRLLRDGLVQLGDHTGRGRPIHVTQLGHAVLDSQEAPEADMADARLASYLHNRK
ncbi:hypothetical protein [Streptacidiphilus jiangxiensis]|uniref:Winged helix DNA-binding domain-containing protein n=1 Tax=Streptacidiphilus jiangxiensis TaxID=235985 RepID=A0A1H7X794_STRJI|nr:hypothetical protein [Streptacidiphilus jiangxiensis]SEM29535.1 hypothetical protein SAMN05414137_1238 [Streptacidiphilus jiangxiensis]